MSPEPTIAHYRVVAKLGEGGMGAVYRATDTKLGRDVAIKVLPEAFAADAGRMARFEREAQLLASLNHPNIATVFGVEQGALIMELVEGPDLAGPVSVEIAIEYARQIAAGLEAAHEKGIIHRDLKPANIKVTPEGVVKLLDFGLARATEESTVSASATMSPTLSLAMTQAGMILGTAAYMSPEQARGKPVDKRSDIWAFGVVLFELLTGSMLYGGETVSDSMAAVITREPDWDALPKATPPHVRRLLMRCLRKDPKVRLRDIGEARILLSEPPEVVTAAPVQASVAKRSWMPWALGAALAAAIVLGGMLWKATRPVEKPLLRFSADMGDDAVAGSRTTAAISPDGTRLVYPVRPAGSTTMLATRLMEQSKEVILSGTDNGMDPFFSPDGQWIGFYADQHLKKVAVLGGAPVPLCETGNVRGAAWGEDGNIIFGNTTAGLMIVPAGGGTPRTLTKPADKGETTHRWPQILPGGETVLFTGHSSAGAFNDANVEVLSLKTGQTRIVQRGGYFGRYVPSGHMLYIHQSTLFAVPFDLGRNETRGLPAPVLDDLAGVTSSGGGQVDFSSTGTLVYLRGKSSGEFTSFFLLDATGKKEPLTSGGTLRAPRFSPDGKQLAFASKGDIAVYDLVRGSTTRLTTNPSAVNNNPVWMPDGKHLIYSENTGKLLWIRGDGSSQPQVIFQTQVGNAVAGSLTPDGRTVVFHQGGNSTGRDLWILPLDLSDPDHPKPGAAEVFLATKGNDVDPAFSPDGRWLAYASDVSGSVQVFVRPFPEGAKGGGQAQVSTAPGRAPLWSRTSKEIFYLSVDGHITVVPYTINGRTFQPGKPRVWSNIQVLNVPQNTTYDLAPDGKHFAAVPTDAASEGSEKTNLHLTFLLNFFDFLKQRVPAK